MAVCDAYECKIFTPWRLTTNGCITGTPNPNNGVFHKIDGTGAVTEIAWFGAPGSYTDCRVMYLNEEDDPELQTLDTDFIVPPGGVFCMRGTLRFNNPGCHVSFIMESYNALSPTWDVSGEEMVITLYGEPGRSITISGCGTFHFGVQAESECQAATLTSCDVAPHESHGVAHRDNGGFAGLPGALETDLNFNICFDLNGPQQRLTYDGDFGDGYMETLQFTNTLHAPLPGEPIYCPHVAGHSNQEQDLCSHAGHKVRLSVTVGSGTFDGDNPPVILKNMVAGHVDCVPNPDFVDTTDDQI